ncbi:MAG: hypothetical protein JXB32_11170 [Deltaproteobacteria bacterium]|nr:hypothetical protein [Deltaproteobacteria bacterium]
MGMMRGSENRCGRGRARDRTARLAAFAAAALAAFVPRPAGAVCGDGVLEPGEACDGAELGGHGCTTVMAGYAGGTLACRADCTGYDVLGCTRGGEVTAASCSQADVQTAVDAAGEGDTVLVPAGRCTWTVPVNLGRVAVWDPPTYESRNVLIRGAGAGRTVIVSATGEAWDQRPFWIVCQAGKPFRITGFTFTGMQRRGSTEPAINVGGACRNWRIDHNTFDVSDRAPGTQGRGLIVADYSYGLVDHNTFLDTYQGVLVVWDGAASYERPLSLGTEQAVYIEDNVFDYADDYAGDGANDASHGARYVLRHNRLRNAFIGHHGCDSGGHRATHSFEIYANDIEWTSDEWWYASRYRDGTGVVYDNVLTGSLHELTFGVVNYRTCCCNWCTGVDPAAPGYPCEPYTACAEPLHTNCSEWGRCDGANPLDGNLDATGWPCLDQTGRSTDEDGDGIQDLQPLYEWNNTLNGEDADVTVSDPWGCTGPSMVDHLQEGRDFFNDTPRPGYVAYPYPHPLAREADPWPDGDAGPTDSGAAFQGGGGCGCAAAGTVRVGGWLLALAVATAWLARRIRRAAWLVPLAAFVASPACRRGAAADLPPGACAALEARYLSVRASLNRCERDDDCAEIWPGLCPHGPHYVHREADVPGLFAVERRFYAECPVSECEKPERLGIAHCEAGRCVPGREPAPERPDESCWDAQETYLEDGRRESAATEEHLRGLTPLLAYGAAASGTLRLEVDWGDNCPDCRLEISEHNSGMASLVEGVRHREGGRETIALPATPGVYYLLGRRAGPSISCLVTVSLERTDGAPAVSTLHGVSWQRRCEG